MKASFVCSSVSEKAYYDFACIFYFLSICRSDCYSVSSANNSVSSQITVLQICYMH